MEAMPKGPAEVLRVARNVRRFGSFMVLLLEVWDGSAEDLVNALPAGACPLLAVLSGGTGRSGRFSLFHVYQPILELVFQMGLF